LAATDARPNQQANTIARPHLYDNEIKDVFSPMRSTPASLVTNLFSYVLNNDELNILNKGLNFCPTPNPNKREVITKH